MSGGYSAGYSAGYGTIATGGGGVSAGKQTYNGLGCNMGLWPYNYIGRHGEPIPPPIVFEDDYDRFEFGTTAFPDPPNLAYTVSDNTIGGSLDDLEYSNWGGRSRLYNVGAAGAPNRALGWYAFVADRGVTFRITFVAPAGVSSVSISADVWAAWNRYSAAEFHRWSSMSFQLVEDGGATVGAEEYRHVDNSLVDESAFFARTWYEKDELPLGSLLRPDRFVLADRAVTPGQTYYLRVNGMASAGVPPGETADVGRDINICWDNLRMEFAE